MLHLIDSWDRSIVLFLNQFAAKSAVFDEVMYDLADATILQGGLFMAYFWWVWFRQDGGDAAVADRRQKVVLSIAGAIVAVIVSRTLQVTLPFHLRPLHTPSLHFVLPLGVNPQTLNMWNSLPSDHAVIYFALATAVWFQSRPLGYAAMAWSLIVGLIPRIYLGYHYPSDIVAGVICGTALMALIWRVTPRNRLLGPVVAAEQSHRLAFYAVAFLLTYELAILFYDLRHLVRDGYDIARALTGVHVLPHVIAAD
jgi:undecaprenyl-diphosphatase